MPVPVTDYTTLALVKAALQISDSSEDTLISSKITAASQQIDQLCGRTFTAAGSAAARILNTRGRVVWGPDGHRLLVDDIGSLTGLTVESGTPGGSTWTDITSRVEAHPLDAIGRGYPVTELLLLSGCWPARVRITVPWGWPAQPAVVGEAALIQTVRLYKRKDSAEGVLGSAEWSGPVRVARFDPDVAALLAPLVLPGLG